MIDRLNALADDHELFGAQPVFDRFSGNFINTFDFFFLILFHISFIVFVVIVI